MNPNEPPITEEEMRELSLQSSRLGHHEWSQGIAGHSTVLLMDGSIVADFYPNSALDYAVAACNALPRLIRLVEDDDILLALNRKENEALREVIQELQAQAGSREAEAGKTDWKSFKRDFCAELKDLGLTGNADDLGIQEYLVTLGDADRIWDYASTVIHDFWLKTQLAAPANQPTEESKNG